MNVGIRELKARLSEYVERVEGGETLVVTSRGRQVALIIPVPGRGNLDRGLREGWLTRREERPPAPFEPREPLAGTRTTLEILQDDRTG